MALQKLHCACSQRLHPHFFVAMCRDEDDRILQRSLVQLRLQLEAGHPWHTDCPRSDRQSAAVAGFRNSRGCKSLCWQANAFQQACNAPRISYHQSRMATNLARLGDHDKNFAASPKVAHYTLV